MPFVHFDNKSEKRNYNDVSLLNLQCSTYFDLHNGEHGMSHMAMIRKLLMIKYWLQLCNIIIAIIVLQN